MYVDDLIITENNDEAIALFVEKLSKSFSLKDLDPLHYFLGVEEVFAKDGLFLNQSKYIRELLEKYAMIDAIPMSTPMATNSNLKLMDGSSEIDETRFR